MSPAHGLDADAYRGAFGLAQNTKLVGPTYRTKRIEVSGDHMRELAKEHGIRKGSLTTEERREQSLKAVRRVEHQLNSTEPERARFPLNARLGSDEGYPVEVLDGVRSGFRRRGSEGPAWRVRPVGGAMGRWVADSEVESDRSRAARQADFDGKGQIAGWASTGAATVSPTTGELRGQDGAVSGVDWRDRVESCVEGDGVPRGEAAGVAGFAAEPVSTGDAR